MRGPARAGAFEALEGLYARLEAEIAEAGPRCFRRGVCCEFENAGHELFATAFETDFAIARAGAPPEPEAPGRCPYHRSGLCTAREGRPLGCRVYFCDPAWASRMPDLYERYYAEVRAMAATSGYAHDYGRFPEAVARRATETRSPTP